MASGWTGNISNVTENVKIFNDEWRINWTTNIYILHHHPKTRTVKWVLCGLEEDNCEGPEPTNPENKGCRKGIHYTCRDKSCNTKVPAGIVAIGLTRKLSKTNEG